MSQADDGDDAGGSSLSCSTTTSPTCHIMPIVELTIKSGSGSMPRVAAIALTVAIVAFALPASAHRTPISRRWKSKRSISAHTYRLEGKAATSRSRWVRRHHHGRWPIRTASRQDQGRNCSDFALTGQISGQHPFSWRPHRRKCRFQKDGAIVVAQDNVRVRLAAGTTNGLTGNKTPPVAPEAPPEADLHWWHYHAGSGWPKALLTHVNNAHTDGDTWVYFAGC